MKRTMMVIRRPVCLLLDLCLLLVLPKAHPFTINPVYSKPATELQRSLSKSCSSPLPPARRRIIHCAAEIRGDPLREASGIRPSLHPVTINAIAEALKVRAKNVPDTPLRVSDSVESLQVALSASKLAVDAIEKRQTSSNQDGMKLTAPEEQTIAGRVVGVVMRLDDLEATLAEKCQAVGWIAKYNEWNSFGVLKEESTEQVDEQILSDPLFSMNRAECLLALFLSQVEAPSLEKSGESVAGGSEVDFLDDDRREVLLGE